MTLITHLAKPVAFAVMTGIAVWLACPSLVAQDDADQPFGRIAPSAQSKAKILIDIALIQDRVGDKKGSAASLNAARKLESSITDPSIKIDYLEGLGKLLQAPGQKAEAMKLAAASEAFATENEDDTVIAGHGFRNAASIYGRLGERAKYSRAIKKARESYAKIRARDQLEDDWRSRWFSRLIETQLEAKDTAGASKTADLITSDEELRGEALVAIVEAQIITGDPAAARETLKRVPATFSGLRLDAFLEFAKAEFAKGDKAAYQKSLAQAFDAAAGLKGDSLQGEGLVDILTAQSEIKDTAGAIKTTAKIIDHALKDESPESISDLAVHQIEELDDKAGGLATLEKALALAAKEKDPVKQSWFLTSIAVGYAKAGEVAKSLEAAGKIEDPVNKADALTQLADIQLGAGDKAGSGESLKLAFLAVGGIKAEEDRSEQMLRIVDAWAELGDFAAAERVAKSIPTADYRDQSMQELALRKKLAAADDVNGGEPEEPWSLAEVPDELGTPDEKAKALEAVANAQEVIGQVAAAKLTRAQARALRKKNRQK